MFSVPNHPNYNLLIEVKLSAKVLYPDYILNALKKRKNNTTKKQ